MSALVELYRPQLLVFVFVLARVGGLVLTAPALAARSAPWHVRVALTVAVALLIAPVYWAAPTVDAASPIELIVPLCREVVLGVVLGLALAALIAGVQAAGQTIGQMSGLTVSEALDPGLDISGPVFARLYGLTATAVFLAIGGHRQLLAALLDTFHWMPPGQVGFSGGMIATLSDVAGQSFLLALRVAAPVLLALLLTTLALALIGRVLPQLSVFHLGLGLNSLLAVAVMAVSLGAAVWVFQEHLAATLDTVRTAMEGDAGSSAGLR